jgi:hypothetical protein
MSMSVLENIESVDTFEMHNRNIEIEGAIKWRIHGLYVLLMKIYLL